jgi:hypothetical protein
MLWLKAWLETRSRVVFLILWSSGFLLLFVGGASREASEAPRGVQTVTVVLSAMALVWVFMPAYLAGAGIRTQSGFGAAATKGLHGSTHFTLSLPVSRRRLLLVRATVGFLETLALITLVCAAIWIIFPVLRESATLFEVLQYLLTVYVCSFGVYGLAVLAASLLDDVWIIPVSTVAIVLIWTFQFVGAVPAPLNPFYPMAEGSSLVTHRLPWAAMAVSLALGSACVFAALKVVRKQEF